jgi:nitrogenase molybdenum-iron protein alpha/beta subunit
MTGAAACLAGVKDMTVIIHGSSGCYYYPASLLHVPLQGTFIMEEEVIFGSEGRLKEVIAGLDASCRHIAIVTTCVPAVVGEDVRHILDEREAIVVDSPGFAGSTEAGYRRAMDAIGPVAGRDTRGVNIDGICLLDPFSRGNTEEIVRLLARAGVPCGAIFSLDTLERIRNAAPFTLGTNDDFSSGVGTPVGGTLGFAETRDAFVRIEKIMDGSDIAPVIREIDESEELAIQACDKYLRRFDPPATAIFSGHSYGVFAARMLKRYLDAQILCIGTRTGGTDLAPGEIQVQDHVRIGEMIGRHAPDLILGSSFERSFCGDAAFYPVTPPIRGMVRLVPRPIAGPRGSLAFLEGILNECIDRQNQSRVRTS